MRDELTLSGYTAVSDKMIEDPEFAHLDSRALLAWSKILDRYQLSFGNYKFYDKKQKDWYAIYPNSDLMKALHVGDRTVTKFIKSLVNAGLLLKKKAFNGVNKYFPLVPKRFTKAKDAESASNHLPQHSDVSIPQMVRFNYFISTTLSLSFNAFNAVNTTNNETPEKSVPAPQTKTKTANDHQKLIQQIKFNAQIEHLQTQIHMSPNIIDALKLMSFNSIGLLSMYSKAIFTAKKTAKAQFTNNKQLVTSPQYQEAFTFEGNPYYQETLATQIKKIVVCGKEKAKKRSTSHDEFMDNWRKYLVVSFTNYFIEAGTNYLKDCAVIGTPIPHISFQK